MKYSHLFEPIQLGRRIYKNRIFYSPTGYKEQPVDEAASFYERKALGGVASVCVGNACIAEDGLAMGNMLRAYTRNTVPAFEQISSAIARGGAIPALELIHGGNCSHYSVELGFPLYGPVDGETEDGIPFKAMTEEQILACIRQYAEAAAFAVGGGFERIILHAGHGWQLSQFLSPALNKRRDRWGGDSIENRARFAVAACEAIKKRCPTATLEVRMSGSECYDGGYDIDEGVKIAMQLDGHCDIIHVSASSHEVPIAITTMSPSMFKEDGVNVKYAAEIKKHVSTPVATVGALSDVDLMEEILATGKADVVEVARGLLADPDLPLKAQMGHEDEINRCMRCLFCYSHHMHRNNYRCAINPIVGNEHEMKHELPVKVKKKLLVVGGGMGGMQAAVTAAQRGHEVILCEKNSRLGGNLLCEEPVPFKFGLRNYIHHQEMELEKLGVDVRLNTAVTPDYIRKAAPDAAIVSIGAEPVIPRFIPGWDRPNVFSAEYLYTHIEEAGQKVVIVGGGLVGMELAVYCAMNGRDVTILEMLPVLSDGGNNLQGLAISGEFEKYHVKVSASTQVLEITEDGVRGKQIPAGEIAPRIRFSLPLYGCLASEEGTLFPADTVAYAVGYRPKSAEALELRKAINEVYLIGDCVMPKNIQQATSQGFFAARNLGRLY